MALVLNIKAVENLSGKADRLAKASFRGHVHQSRLVRSAKRVAYFGQTFEWPIARPVEQDETLTIHIINFNKYLANKVIGIYELSLQQIIYDGELKLTEPLVDLNNRIMDTTISFELCYYSPDGEIGRWGQDEFSYPLTDEPIPDHVDPDETGSLFGISGRDTTDFANLEDAGILGGEDTVSQTLMLDAMFKDSKKRMDQIDQDLHKPRDFQICVRILEAQQLVGLDIDPVVKVQVGDNHKYTNIKQSTNCPYFDEYFVWDFRESAASIFDKMITISVYHSYNIPGRHVFKAGHIIGAKRMIGDFKLDVATVYTAPNHMFYHKWAMLIDPRDIGDGPKGYVKCDISVIGKGDVVKAPKGVKEEDTQNIEGNLLLPSGISRNRETAVYSVNIYRGEDLPRTDYGIMASVRKALTSGPVAFVDAYIKVSLAGHVGKTSVKKSYNPAWKESLRFVDKFPPLCNRIKVQIYDSESFKDESIATHFIELSTIMDPGGDADGILPTFGPSWVNFYGAPRAYKLLSEHDDLNTGQGEGSAYRGRILMSISTKIMKDNVGKSQVLREKIMRTGTLMENQPRKEFVLFGTLFSATMIDKELRDKPIYFELSIGRFGNTLDGKAVTKITQKDDEDNSSDDDDPSQTLVRKRKEEEMELPSKSITTPEVPQTSDKNYYYVPFQGRKPCLYIHSLFEDTKKRLYHTILLEKVVDEFDEGLNDVKQMLKVDYENLHQRLRGVLKKFEEACQNYMTKVESPMLKSTSALGKTDLDKYRLKMCRNKVDRFKNMAQGIRTKVTRGNAKEKFKEAREISRRMRHLSKDPQHSLPDVFVWMIADKKRIAYYRIPAKDILHSNMKEFTGKQCGKLQTIFLRKPGKKSIGPSGWTMQGKLEVYLWLGEKDNKKGRRYMEHMPPGYEVITTPPQTIPDAVYYKEEHKFQLRAYLYQARGLIGSDDTGLSDPFARVILGNQCQTTQYVDETLSPTWDETLVFKDITVYGPMTEILSAPPVVIIEIYDYDAVFGSSITPSGQPEFLGRAIVKPKVKTSNDYYEAPDWPAPLEWHDVYRGPKNCGDLLASFELIEEDGSEIPELPEAQRVKRGTIVPLPQVIKPILRKYRLEVLFWGIREPKRIQLLTVDRPRADLEMAGHVVSSTIIQTMDKNSNFEDPLRFIDIELPENEMFWPPITIRVTDLRKFGRDVLVGTCTIVNSQQFIWIPPEERERHLEELRKKKLKMLPLSEQVRQARMDDMDEIQRAQLEFVTAAIAQGVQFTASRPASVVMTNELDNQSLRKGSMKNGRTPSMSMHGSVMLNTIGEDNRSIHSNRSVAASTRSVAASNRTNTLRSRDTASMHSRRSGVPEVMYSTNGSLRSTRGLTPEDHATIMQADNTSLRSRRAPSQIQYPDGTTSNDVIINMDTRGMNGNGSLPSIGFAQPSAHPVHPVVVGPDGTLRSTSGTPLAAADITASPPPLGPDGKPMEIGPDGMPIQPPIGADGKPLKPVYGPDGKLIPPIIGPDGIATPQALGPDGRPLQQNLGPDGKPVMPTLGPDGKPLPPGSQSGPPPVEKPKVSAKKRRELIADLDWWSKYYATQEDLERSFRMKEESRKKQDKKKGNSALNVAKAGLKELGKKGDDGSETKDTAAQHDEPVTEESSESSSEDENPDFIMNTMDFGELDDAKLVELRENAVSSSDDDDPKKKKRKKKLKKKQKKKDKKKKKKLTMKEKMEKAKGKVNKAFKKDDEDDDDLNIMDVDEVEEMEDKSVIARFKVYQQELENVKGYDGFNTLIQNYPLLRGKKMDDEDNDFLRISAKFKGTVCIYEVDDKAVEDAKTKKPELKLSKGLPSFKPHEVKVMIYIVRAVDLHPVDANGKADPYMIIRCGRKEINDKDNRMNNQLNPVFGKLFEFDTVFPMDSNVRIQVWDYDRLSADDLIGETFIDLENRYFSKHRPRCGYQRDYEEYGYNIWRDAMKPGAILEQLCKEHDLPPPKFTKDCVYVDGRPFYAKAEVEIETGEMRPSNEPLALEVIRNWEDIVPDCPIVPEHLESRSLYLQEKPGVEQGKVEMWIDMFPKDQPLPSVTVDITPRQPKSYELRCIIWNMDDVRLDDTNMLTGEASSDIFVKGYLKGVGEDDQSTDVHYRSLTGEGNFNWRFVFPFDYLKSEERVVYATKAGAFDTSDTEMKVPAKLTLQVWDADLVSADDFLGYITLDLNRIPRPVKDAKRCTEKWMNKIVDKDKDVPLINLFKMPKGIKGWWPMVAKDTDTDENELVGKVEAELLLLPAEDAERDPAGLGRSDPQALPEPNRPDTSFLWFMNPLKTLRYIICRQYKWLLIKLLILALLGVFITLMVYNAPGAMVNKVFGL